MPSKLEQMQLQFRQKLMQEKEERMIKIHNDSQQKALSKVTKYNGIQNTRAALPVSKTIGAPPAHHSPVKKGSPGVDRSRPLPPIAKESRKYISTSNSPVTSPVEIGFKMTDRSKSVDLVSRPSPSSGSQNGRAQLKNGYAKPSHETDTKPSTVNQAQSEKKSEQDLVAKLKQAELQRLRANSKFQAEETPPRNGYATYSVNKSSSEKKPVSITRTQVTPRSEPKPKAPAASTFKRSTPQPSKVQPAANQGRKPPGPGQEQCTVCGRNFNMDRIEKHRTICSKAAKKKVKVFDVTKMRVQGTEAEQYVKKGLPKTTPKPKNSNWRKQHQEFIEAIRQAKLVQQHVAAGGKLSDLPPPPPSDTSHYVQCPHCGRKFNQGVAERHIPKCKDIQCNKKAPVPKRK